MRSAGSRDPDKLSLGRWASIPASAPARGDERFVLLLGLNHLAIGDSLKAAARTSAAYGVVGAFHGRAACLLRMASGAGQSLQQFLFRDELQPLLRMQRKIEKRLESELWEAPDEEVAVGLE